MASTKTANLDLEKIADGEQENTWGASQRTNQDDLDTAICGFVDVNVAGSIDVTLTKAQFDQLAGLANKDGSTDELLTRQLADREASDKRKKALAAAIQDKVRHGWRVESRSDFNATLVRGRRVNHLLHFLIGLFTFGVWWLLWILITVTGGERRQALTFNENGKVIWGRKAKG